MGSSGSSRFSDYPESPPTEVSTGGGLSGVSGGSGGADRCDRAFTTVLEDFERSSYFVSKGEPPTLGTDVTIRIKTRLIAETLAGESLGNLPTKYNYLAGCMADGRSYVGRVAKVAGGLLARISIDVGPQ